MQLDAFVRFTCTYTLQQPDMRQCRRQGCKALNKWIQIERAAKRGHWRGSLRVILRVGIMQVSSINDPSDIRLQGCGMLMYTLEWQHELHAFALQYILVRLLLFRSQCWHSRISPVQATVRRHHNGWQDFRLSRWGPHANKQSQLVTALVDAQFIALLE